jgi:hypothetical protein
VARWSTKSAAISPLERGTKLHTHNVVSRNNFFHDVFCIFYIFFFSWRFNCKYRHEGQPAAPMVVAAAVSTTHVHTAPLVQTVLTPDAPAPSVFEPVPVVAEASPSADAADDIHAAETVAAVVAVVVETSETTSEEGVTAAAAAATDVAPSDQDGLAPTTVTPAPQGPLCERDHAVDVPQASIFCGNCGRYLCMACHTLVHEGAEPLCLGLSCCVPAESVPLPQLQPLPDATLVTTDAAPREATGSQKRRTSRQRKAGHVSLAQAQPSRGAAASATTPRKAAVAVAVPAAPAPAVVLAASAVPAVTTTWSRPCRVACPFNHDHSPDRATTAPAASQKTGRRVEAVPERAALAVPSAVPLTWAERARQGRTPSPAPLTSARSATG